MRAWFVFWVASFVIATLAFAIIALVISIGGVGDLRRMLAGLSRGEGSE